MAELMPNSDAHRDAVKQKQASVSIKKKPLAEEAFGDIFMSDLKTAGLNTWRTTIVPWIQNLIVSGMNALMSGIVYGTGGQPQNVTRVGNVSYIPSPNTKVDYRGMSNYGYDHGAQGNIGTRRSNGSSPMKISDLEFTTREKAEEVLSDILDTLENYNVISVGNILEACSDETVQIPTTPMDFNYGWLASGFGGASVEPIPGGKWIIKMPRPVALPRR